MIEIKACKIGKALFSYCKCYETEYDSSFIPSLMATSMVVFLLKHPKLLQTQKYELLYNELLEFQIEDIYFSLREFRDNIVDDLDRNELRKIAEMLNDIELNDEDSKVYEIELSDIEEFISDCFH